MKRKGAKSVPRFKIIESLFFMKKNIRIGNISFMDNILTIILNFLVSSFLIVSLLNYVKAGIQKY